MGSAPPKLGSFAATDVDTWAHPTRSMQTPPGHSPLLSASLLLPNVPISR